MSANTFRISVDSRQRISGSKPYDAQFRLQRTIGPVKSVRLVHATFVNHLFNVRKNQNFIMASNDGGNTFSQQYVLPVGYYTYEGFVNAVNTWSTNYVGSDCLVVPATPGPQIEWVMPVNLVLVDGPLKDILGIYSNPVTGLKSNVFLAIPLSVSMVCPSLSSGTRHLSCDTSNTELPIMVQIPVTCGYGTNNVYIPPAPYEVVCETQQIDTLNILMVDSFNGSVMTDVQHWSCELEIELF